MINKKETVQRGSERLIKVSCCKSPGVVGGRGVAASKAPSG